ncbi:hypothetical protein B0H19DRAFT_1084549 [Mycena capillaripes]|nr:hypothetical protein B0H19DRAFT_1084549 [Mycena capillaripes]
MTRRICATRLLHTLLRDLDGLTRLRLTLNSKKINHPREKGTSRYRRSPEERRGAHKTDPSLGTNSFGTFSTQTRSGGGCEHGVGSSADYAASTSARSRGVRSMTHLIVLAAALGPNHIPDEWRRAHCGTGKDIRVLHGQPLGGGLSAKKRMEEDIGERMAEAMKKKAKASGEISVSFAAISKCSSPMRTTTTTSGAPTTAGPDRHTLHPLPPTSPKTDRVPTVIEIAASRHKRQNPPRRAPHLAAPRQNDCGPRCTHPECSSSREYSGWEDE